MFCSHGHKINDSHVVVAYMWMIVVVWSIYSFK